MAHRIFAHDEGEADFLATMFEGEGIPVRFSRHRPGSFVEIEVGGDPAAGRLPDRWR